MFKVIVAGSRTFDDYKLFCEKLDYLFKDQSDEICIICGLAKGADMLGQRYAINNHLYIKYYPADWHTNGKSAGIIRNIQMAEEADALVAFWDGESKSTKHMIDIAKKKRLKVRIINV